MWDSMWRHLFESPNIWQIWLPFFSGIVATLVALRISGRSNYGSTVTSERSKWINALRENIAGLAAAVAAARLGAEMGKHAEAGVLERIHRLSGLVTLQLNPNGIVDRNILRIIPPFVAAAGNPSEVEQFQRYQMALFSHAQFLLKEEWEKVKSEASSLLWKITIGRFQRMYRTAAYRKFCGTKGSMLSFAPQLPVP